MRGVCRSFSCVDFPSNTHSRKRPTRGQGGVKVNEREIFIQALEIEDATERSSFLDETCGTGELLRQRVEGLVEAHECAGPDCERAARVSEP